MSVKPKLPGMLVVAGAMLLILGAISSYVGWRQNPAAKVPPGLEGVSRGGDPAATVKFEQSVNRYIESVPSLSTVDESPERITAYLNANGPCAALLDQATSAARISFRRNWICGFDVERLGVVDIHNLGKLNYYRMTVATDPAEIKRLAASVRTLANYLEFDPMVASVRVYAPTYQLYLAALKYALEHNVYSPEERLAISDALAADAARARRMFAAAPRNESLLAQGFPRTVIRNYSGRDVIEAAAELDRLSQLIEAGTPESVAELAAWKVADNPVSAKIVPDRGYIELLDDLLSAIAATRKTLAEQPAKP